MEMLLLVVYLCPPDMARWIKISMNSHIPKPMLWFVDHLLREDIVVFQQLGRLGLHLLGKTINFQLNINMTLFHYQFHV